MAWAGLARWRSRLATAGARSAEMASDTEQEPERASAHHQGQTVEDDRVGQEYREVMRQKPRKTHVSRMTHEPVCGERHHVSDGR